MPVTEDGSFGAKGLVTEPLIQALESGEFTNPTIFACGPEGMLKAVDSIALAHSVPGELALEAPMPCGVGICLGCVRLLNSGGYARVCVEGPVFAVGEAKL